VETAGAADWLRAAGCDAAQGFHYARPAPWRELLDQFGDRDVAIASETTTT
jgi:EAL domain-containing protein (putative c-di-GMP-specific phosphodiesterase class I)